MAFSEQEINRQPCYTDAEWIKLSQGETRELTFTLRNDVGEVIDIDELDLVGSSSAGMNGLITAWFIGKETTGSPNKLWQLQMDITDPATGKVTVTSSPNDITANAGLFIANIAIFVGEQLQLVRPIYVEVTANTLLTNNDPITIAEVRLELRDTCPDANYLLDELEYTDAEIIHCIRKALDEYNSIPPFVHTATPESFKYRAPWLHATVGYLLRIAARHYLRDHLDYSAAGVSVNDKAKWQAYEKLGQDMINEWKAWSQQRKIAINVSNGFFTFGT